MWGKFDFIDKEFLQKEYVEAKSTDIRLAGKLNCSTITVKRRRQLFGIPRNIFLQGKDLLNQRFGNVVVVKESHRKNKRVYWLCKCDCGNEVIISTHDLTRKVTKSCGCLRRAKKEKRYNWNGYKDISGKWWGRFQNNAKKRDIAWEITKEDAFALLEKQDFKCSLSCLPIDVGENASIDRIDSSLSYKLDNIWWVHKDINVIKWDYSIDYFLYLCNMVVNNSNESGSIEIDKKLSKKWNGKGNISGDFWFTVKNNAKIRSIPFEVTIDHCWNLFVRQRGKCAISGLPIAFAKPGTKTIGTASLDRKNSSIGYFCDNIWWVHKDINNIKWKLELNYFLDLCNKIVQTQQKKVICG